MFRRTTFSSYTHVLGRGGESQGGSGRGRRELAGRGRCYFLSKPPLLALLAAGHLLGEGER